MRRAGILLAATIAIAASAAVASAQGGLPDLIHDQLLDDAELQVGCVEPCLCPVYSLPVRGTMILEHESTDFLYDYYKVRDVEWELRSGDGTTIRVVGSGRYQIGGEFALTQRMQLELQVGDRPPQYFDSGLRPGGIGFPKLDISLAVHEFYCFDSIFVVRAAPQVASVGDNDGDRFLIRPNPFSQHATAAFTLAAPARVDLRVVDLMGRDVASLARATLESGRHAYVWNGRDQGGRKSPPGIYFLRLDVGGRVESHRLVKME